MAFCFRKIKLLILIFTLNIVSVSIANASAFQVAVTKSYLPNRFIGQWQVVSEVIWTNCPYVTVGTESLSQINIYDINGKLYPEWHADDWKLVRNKEIEFDNDKSLYWEKESKQIQDDKYWFVKTSNEFMFNKTGNLEATSVTRQYLDGKFVGSYITQSKLFKISEQSGKLAFVQ